MSPQIVTAVSFTNPIPIRVVLYVRRRLQRADPTAFDGSTAAADAAYRQVVGEEEDDDASAATTGDGHSMSPRFLKDDVRFLGVGSVLSIIFMITARLHPSCFSYVGRHRIPSLPRPHIRRSSPLTIPSRTASSTSFCPKWSTPSSLWRWAWP